VSNRLPYVFALLTAAGLAAAADAPTVPAEIALPADQKVDVTLKAHATGYQFYECKADAAGKLGWALRAPIAILAADDGKPVAVHFGGVAVGLPPGPYWMAIKDGSRVHGGSPASSPNTGSIPLLRLQAVDTNGDGTFAHVSFVHRLATQGGVAPAEGCTAAGVRTLVPYTADYWFYSPTK